MARIVLLDAGPLSLACSRHDAPSVDRCRAWLQMLEWSGALVVVPAVADYEVRRELLRLGASAKLRKLDSLRQRFALLNVTLAAGDRAADLWALVRQAGMPTAGPGALDADAILAGMAATTGGPDDDVIVATTNPGHLGRFPGVRAADWVTIA